jgi:hypothetical protein
VQFTFHAPEAQGIRLIKEIPDVAFCHLEGRNGIGKTLSVRLLELACGRQPYAGAPHAWETLRDQRGEITIGIHGMPEGTVEIRLRPTGWPKQPLSGLTDELGEVLLGGHAVSWSALRQLLSVVRIAGDETLTETLARALEQRAVEARLLALDVAPAVAAWDEVLSDLAHSTSGLEPERLDSMAREAEVAETGANSATNLVRAADAALRDSQRLRGAIEGLIRRRDALTDLLSDLERAGALLHSSDERLDQLTKDLQTLTHEAVRGQQARTQLERWERLRNTRDRALSRARIAERQSLRLLELDHRPDTAELNRLVAEAHREKDQAKERRRHLDVTGNLKDLTDDLDQALSDAPPGIDDHIVAATTPPITTARLRDGVRARRSELVGIPKPGEVEALERQEQTADRRLARLIQLQGLIAAREKKEQNVDEASNEIQLLLKSSSRAADSQDLRQSIRQQQDAGVAAAFDAFAAAQKLAELLGTLPIDPRSILPGELPAELSPEFAVDAAEDPWEDTDGLGTFVDRPRPPDTLTDLEEWRQLAYSQDQAAAAELGEAFPDAAHATFIAAPPDHGALDAALTIVVAAVEDRTAELASLTGVAAEANDRAIRTAAAVNEALHRLNDAVRDLRSRKGRWAELRPGLEALMERPSTGRAGTLDADVLALAAGVTRVSKFASNLAEAASRVRDGFDAISRILLTEARTLSPRVAAAAGDNSLALSLALPVDMPGGGRVRLWAQTELAALLGEKALREELFDGAEHLSVDLARARITWRTKSDDRPRVRPLEAFSSGEQVFAYTRARLDLLKTESPAAAHRLVVLDEFGAFVARDRFGQLLEFVRNQALGVVADQVVVMLPLARDYTEHGAATELQDADVPVNGLGAIERITQVARQGYFAVPADPVGV